jgi:Flp pilus assembly protein TadB
MSKSQRTGHPDHDSVDPWDQSINTGRRAATLRWLLPLCIGLVIAALAAALGLRLPEAAPPEALVALALLVPAVLLPVHMMGRRRRRTRCLLYTSDAADDM